MAKISQKEWKRYIELMSQLSDTAANEFGGAIAGLGGYMNLDERQVVSVAYDIVARYSEGSSALTATLYDSIALAQGASVPAAEVFGISFEDVAKAVDAVLRDYTDMNYMNSVVGKMVKQAGADTLVKNAIRDGAEVAWVPSGDTCAFCLTLGSRGWQNVSKRSLKNGHAEHIHPKCDCQYCVRFDSETTVEGYDPEAYQKIYYSAEGNTPKERINSMRRQFYAEDKAKGEGTNNSELVDLSTL